MAYHLRFLAGPAAVAVLSWRGWWGRQRWHDRLLRAISPVGTIKPPFPSLPRSPQTGRPGVGKTMLFGRLTGNDLAGNDVDPSLCRPRMVLSIKATVAPAWRPSPSGSEVARLVDWPGLPALAEGLDAELSSAALVIVVVDGTAFPAQPPATESSGDAPLLPPPNPPPPRRAAAEQLLLALSRGVPEVLVAVNGADRGDECYSAQYVLRRVEEEAAALLTAAMAGCGAGAAGGARAGWRATLVEGAVADWLPLTLKANEGSGGGFTLTALAAAGGARVSAVPVSALAGTGLDAVRERAAAALLVGASAA